MKKDFDSLAATWDDNPTRVRLVRDISAAIIGAANITRTMDVLDFGCGTGLVALSLQPLAGTVTGIDSSAGMLEALERKISAAGIANMKTILHDAESNGPIPGRYHVIVTSMALHHVRNIEFLLKKFHCTLEPGGVLCIADLDPDGGLFHPDNTGVFHFGFDRENMRKMLEQAGFNEVNAVTAAEVSRPAQEDHARTFTVFLVTAKKSCDNSCAV